MKKKRSPLSRADLLIKNPVFKAQLKIKVRDELASLLRAADLQLTFGNHAANTLHTVTRVMWITNQAAIIRKLDQSTPELRIIAGAANAAAELAQHPQDLEKHRPALQSGFAAAERLWTTFDEWTLGKASLMFDDAMSGHGVTTADFSRK